MNEGDWPVEAILLYEAEPKMAAHALLPRLNAAVAGTGPAFDVTPSSTDRIVRLASSRVTVTAELLDERIDPETLASALEAPLARLRADERRVDIARHRHALRLSVEPVPAPGGDPDETPGLVERLVVLHRATVELARLAPPLVMHWRQSDTLHDAGEIEATVTDPFPAALAIRPIPTPGPGKTYGVRADGSAAICGRTLVLAPSEVPLPAAIAITEHIVEQVAYTGWFRDGEAVPVSQTMEAALRFSHEADGTPVAIARLQPAGARAAAAAEMADTAPDRHTDSRMERLADLVGSPDDDELGPVTVMGLRVDTVRTYLLCLGLGVIMPVPALVLALWNVIRGPNLALTAAVFTLAIGVVGGSFLVEIGRSETVANLLSDVVVTSN